MSALDKDVGRALVMLALGFPHRTIAVAVRRPECFVTQVATAIAIVRAERAQ